MSTQLALQFQNARVGQGLTIAQLARLAGYKHVSKGCNRIRLFESISSVHRELLRKVAGILQIDEVSIRELADRDRRDFLDRWARWANEPIQPFVIVNVMPAVYARTDFPEDARTIEDAEDLASSMAEERGQQCCLVWSRMLSCWFSEDGSLSRRSEAVPGKPNMPFMKLPANPRRFMLGETLTSISLLEWPERPRFPNEFDQENDE